jgi:hypothetical protein
MRRNPMKSSSQPSWIYVSLRFGQIQSVVVGNAQEKIPIQAVSQ